MKDAGDNRRDSFLAMAEAGNDQDRAKARDWFGQAGTDEVIELFTFLNDGVGEMLRCRSLQTSELVRQLALNGLIQAGIDNANLKRSRE